MKLLMVVALTSHFLWSATPSASSDLKSELQALKIQEPAPNVGTTSERLYAVQSRSSILRYRPEISLGVGNNFSSGSFVASQNIDGDLHFYFSERVFTALNASYVSSKLTGEAQNLWEKDGKFPDIAPVKFRTDLLVGYHLFYGKFRVSMDTVFYFDQYWALGGGMVQTNNGLSDNWAPAIVGDAGFAFWFGRKWSVRLGFKDYYFNEVRRLSSGNTNHFVGHASVGFVFGGGSGV